MKVSVVAIAKDRGELDALRAALGRQTMKDWELVYSTRKGIPQAMNDAIRKAKGDIIVTTESDAIPLTDTWLEEMAKAVWDNDDNVLIRGMEVSPSSWCWCNLAAQSRILKSNPLDESYPIGEDTELFARLKSMGYRGVELPIAPVLHSRKFKGL